MNNLDQLIHQITNALESNNHRASNLNNQCDNISRLLARTEEALDKLKNSYLGSEVSDEEIQSALRDLNITEVNCHNLRTKLEEILQLALDNNQDLATKNQQLKDKLASVENDLRTILTKVTNHANLITALETKVANNERRARELATKTGVICGGVGLGLGSLAVILTQYLRRARNGG